MKISQAVHFTHEVDGRIYSLVFPIPAPLGECYDVAASVCSEFLSKLKQQEEELLKKATITEPEVQ